MPEAFVTALLELADDHLVLGHRLSEWCGHAPMLEEDLALPNLALDLIGSARALYTYAGEIEGNGRTEDDLAYLRNEREYLNCLLVEKANGDFARTMLRQLYFSVFMELYWKSALEAKDETVAGVAGKALKEMAYHVRHSGEWVIRLGDGTEESARRVKQAVDLLHPLAEELFESSEAAKECEGKGLLPARAEIKPEWEKAIRKTFITAMIEYPESVEGMSGGRQGLHSEALGHLLAEMQYLQRAYPGASW